MTRHKDWVVLVSNRETGEDWYCGPYFEDQAERMANRVTKRCPNGLYTASPQPLSPITPEELNDWAQMDREGTSIQD